MNTIDPRIETMAAAIRKLDSSTKKILMEILEETFGKTEVLRDVKSPIDLAAVSAAIEAAQGFHDAVASK